MTSLDTEHRGRATSAAAPEEPDAATSLLRGIQAAVALAGIAAVAFAAAAIASSNLHFTVAAASALIICAIAASVLVGHALVADRRRFYQRGHVDGWVKGWRGQEPDIEDPLFK